MSRFQFGGTESDWIMSAQDAAAQYGAGALIPRLSPGAVVRFYSALTGGSQHTGLLSPAGATVDTITADSAGALPIFSGPDGGPDRMFADAGGARRLLIANDAASTAVSNHVIDADPHGSKVYADAWHPIVVEYNTATSTWPTAASVPADPTRRWTWVGPAGTPPPIGSGFMREGDIYESVPVA